MSVRRATAPHPLHCPIPPALSPYADTAQLWLTGWLDRFGPALAPAARSRVDGAGFARYAARLYPEADAETLRTLSALFAWFFLLDDDADATAAPDPGRLRSQFTGALGVLRDEDPTGSGGPLHRMLTETWRSLRPAMPPSWRDRFVDAVHHHLGGVVVEAEAKAAGRRPGVEDYVRLRRATSAAYVAHVLTEYATGSPLPDSVHGHPAVRAYSAAGNDLLSWFNDLLSLDRDEVTAGGHNLVLALSGEFGLSTPDAVEAAAVMWRRRMDSFGALRAEVPSFGAVLDVSVRRYLQGVENSVRGTIDWSLESVRYRAPASVAAYLLDRPAWTTADPGE